MRKKISYPTSIYFRGIITTLICEYTWQVCIYLNIFYTLLIYKYKIYVYVVKYIQDKSIVSIVFSFFKMYHSCICEGKYVPSITWLSKDQRSTVHILHLGVSLSLVFYFSPSLRVIFSYFLCLFPIPILFRYHLSFPKQCLNNIIMLLQ